MTLSYRSEEFLREHIRSIMNFYYPTCMDYAVGGYINQLRDDGSVFDADTKHLVGTCRFVYNFATASVVLDEPGYVGAAAHGLAFLEDGHRQPDGGFAWVLSGREVLDGTRHAYGHAFVLLAAAAATKANVPGARELVDQAFDLLERRFRDPGAELYVDAIAPGDWTAVDAYRGQNANMHACEAMLCAWEATDDVRFLDRASALAREVCQRLAGMTDGRIWEHYDRHWQPDWEYNRDDPKHLFRPYGYLPGHFVEWSKLLLILRRHRAEHWHLTRARDLFDLAMARAWDEEHGGMHYTFAPDGGVLDTDRYYWVLAEAFCAAALLAEATGDDEYWRWYERLWRYADERFVDATYGGWYRVLDRHGRRYGDEKSPAAKTDYHPLAACRETLESLWRSSGGRARA